MHTPLDGWREVEGTNPGLVSRSFRSCTQQSPERWPRAFACPAAVPSQGARAQPLALPPSGHAPRLSFAAITAAGIASVAKDPERVLADEKHPG